MKQTSRALICIALFLFLAVSVWSEPQLIEQNVADLKYQASLRYPEQKEYLAIYQREYPLPGNPNMNGALACRVVIKEYPSRESIVQGGFADHIRTKDDLTQRNGQPLYATSFEIRGYPATVYKWTSDTYLLKVYPDAEKTPIDYSFHYASACDQLVDSYLALYPSDANELVQKTREEIIAEREAKEAAQKEAERKSAVSEESYQEWEEYKKKTKFPSPASGPDPNAPDAVAQVTVEGSRVIVRDMKGNLISDSDDNSKNADAIAERLSKAFAEEKQKRGGKAGRNNTSKQETTARTSISKTVSNATLSSLTEVSNVSVNKSEIVPQTLLPETNETTVPANTTDNAKPQFSPAPKRGGFFVWFQKLFFRR